MNKKPTSSLTFLHKAGRRIVFSVMTLYSLGLVSTDMAQASTAPQQLIDATYAFLEQAVTDYLQRSSIQGRPEIQVNRLDPRLRLTACDTPLNVALENPAHPIGRLSIRIQCDSNTPWTVFMPAQVRLFREVIVATRPLQRQALIAETDIALAERDVGLLGQGYLTQPEQAIGQVLNRALITDQILSPNALQQPVLIRKGDHVTINALKGGINVRMPGEALTDGLLEQQIRIKNLSSGRIVKAWVKAPGQVEVNF